MGNSASIKQTQKSVTLRSSLEDVHVVTLPALSTDQIHAYELDVWSRFDGITDVEDINQLDCRLVESRLCVIDRQERIVKSQTIKVDHDQIDEIDFLLDEATIQKQDLEQCLEEINALKRQVEDQVKTIADGMIQLKADRFMCKRGLQEREDEATQCLRKLLATMEQVSQPVTKIPIPIAESTKATCGDFISSKPRDQKIGYDNTKRIKSNTKDKNNTNPSQFFNRRFKNIKSKLNTGRQKVEHAEDNAPIELTDRQNGEHTQEIAPLDQRFCKRNGERTKENTPLEQRTGLQNVEHTKEITKLEQRGGRQNGERTKENASLEQRSGVQNAEHTDENTPLEQHILSSNVIANNKQAANVEDKWWKRVPHASRTIDCENTKIKGRKKKIKSKLDTRRTNSEGHKAAVKDEATNLGDIKTHGEGNSYFVNKQPLPQIKNIAIKKAVTKDKNLILNRNGNNSMRTPLPEVKCRDRHVSGAINSRSATEGALSPLSFGSSKSSPLPPIKSSRGDKLNTESKSGTNISTKDGGTAGFTSTDKDCRMRAFTLAFLSISCVACLLIASVTPYGYKGWKVSPPHDPPKCKCCDMTHILIFIVVFVLIIITCSPGKKHGSKYHSKY